MRALFILAFGLITAYTSEAQYVTAVFNEGAPNTPIDSNSGGGCTGSSGSWTCTGMPTITLTDTGALTIYYSIGGMPSCPSTGTLYTGPFAGSSSTFTLKAIGCNGITGGGVLTSVYTISSTYIYTGLTTKTQGGATIITQSITVGASQRVLAACAIGATGATATFNSVSMATDASVNYTGGSTLYIFSLYVAATTTANLAVSWTGTHSSSCIYSEVLGTLSSGSADQTHTGTGSNSSPTSGATGTTGQANEFLYGAVGVTWTSGNPGIGGTWSNSFTDGQTAAQASIAVDEGYNIVSSTGAYTAAKTGISTTNISGWGAGIVTYK